MSHAASMSACEREILKSDSKALLSKEEHKSACQPFSILLFRQPLTRAGRKACLRIRKVR
jgi:hypothetical protein